MRREREKKHTDTDPNRETRQCVRLIESGDGRGRLAALERATLEAQSVKRRQQKSRPGAARCRAKTRRRQDQQKALLGVAHQLPG